MLTTTIIVLALLLILAVRLVWCLLQPPDFTIGGVALPYMNRWWVIPRNRLFNIYLHQILRSDDDRALHDHPWLNVSIVLAGRYWEVVPQHAPSFSWPVPPTRTVLRAAGSIVVRRPTAAHRLEILGEDRRYGRDCWSLFVTGPNVRTWGFWCPKGWRKWTEFVDACLSA